MKGGVMGASSFFSAILYDSTGGMKLMAWR